MCNEDEADNHREGGENGPSEGAKAGEGIFELAVRDFLGGKDPACIKLTCLQCPSVHWHNLTKGFVLSLLEITKHFDPEQVQ